MVTNLDYAFIDTLAAVSDSREGSLFRQESLEAQRAQLGFIEKILLEKKPMVVLEIGTHKAFFDYVCCEVLRGNVLIYTIDPAPWSGTACGMVNARFGARVVFLMGRSFDIMPGCLPQDGIDLAFIDGDHSPEAIRMDLHNCQALGIKQILLDDYGTGLPVVDEFCQKKGYLLKRNVPEDGRGMVFLEKM